MLDERLGVIGVFLGGVLLLFVVLGEGLLVVVLELVYLIIGDVV